MNNRRLDAQVATALGDTGAFMGGDAYLATQASREDIPPYSSDYAAVALVRAEVERRRLEERWSKELCKSLGISWYPLTMGIHDVWPIVTATPEQQCRAFLRSCGVEDV